MRTAINDGYTCPNCGAPVTTEICEFCGAPTAIASKNADMKYPAIECDEADIDKGKIQQTLSMGIVFLIFSIGMPVFFLKLTDETEGMGFLMFVAIIFGIIGVLMILITLKNTYKFILTNLLGQKIHGYVWGYMDNKRNDGVIHGGISDRTGGQIIKILTHTTKGPIFLLYELRYDEQPYGIKHMVTLKKYKNMFLITHISEKT